MIPFSPPRIDQAIIDEVTAALQSGWITTGPRTKQFEKEIAAYCDVPAVLAVNSWTSGAEMLLRWFGIKEGDEVIVPAYTYCASANIVVHCGAQVVLVEMEVHMFMRSRMELLEDNFMAAIVVILMVEEEDLVTMGVVVVPHSFSQELVVQVIQED